MSTQYSIIQYVPNPVADERINIGILAWNSQEIRSKFIADWKRIKNFGDEDISFLKELAEQIRTLTGPQSVLPATSEPFTTETIQRMISNWGRSIQLTDIRGSLEVSPSTLLRDIEHLFLPVKPSHQRGAKGKRWAAKRAQELVFSGLAKEIPIQAPDIVQIKRPLRGRLDEHKFDIVLANGSPFAAVEALSFQVETSTLRNAIDSIAWTLQDTRSEHRKMEFAVFVVPPTRADTLFDRAVKIFQGLHAQVLENAQMEKWARSQAKRLKH